MPRPIWETDKTRMKCELSSCNRTSEKDFGVCWMHRIIAFNEAKGYNIFWVMQKQSESASQNALRHTNKLEKDC